MIVGLSLFNRKSREGTNENFYINGRLQTLELYKNGIKEGFQKNITLMAI